MQLRQDADRITREVIAAALPDQAVVRALAGKSFPGRVILAAVGKAAWQMAQAAQSILGKAVEQGVVITKYGHAKGALPGIVIFEAGHPVPDENSFSATEALLQMTASLQPKDTVLFLVSGGGSALFESPKIPQEEMQDITKQLLACGADIAEINTIRKHLSNVKGGRFAQHCAPAKIFAIVLSDVIGDALDMIASGPAYPDQSTCEDALRIADRYALTLSKAAIACLHEETPKSLDSVETVVTGSVRQLCATAVETCKKLGYRPIVLTDCLTCEAREAGRFLGSIARYNRNFSESVAYICGGETVVHLTGSGLGGRNQELALAAAEEIRGLDGICVFSVGSDGTDGPTDAAGGYADGSTAETLEKEGVSIPDVLRQNDAYHALQLSGGLIMTGPTGTNVNDFSVVLIRR